MLLGSCAPVCLRTPASQAGSTSLRKTSSSKLHGKVNGTSTAGGWIRVWGQVEERGRGSEAAGSREEQRHRISFAEVE